MAGGISYVLERIIKKGKSEAHKGAYNAQADRDVNGVMIRFYLTHYGTNILRINFIDNTVTGGYRSVSSSGAINEALRAFHIPCWWSYSEKRYGFHCSEGWKGNPAYTPKVSDLLAVEGYEYSPSEKKRLRKLEKILYGSKAPGMTPRR